MFQQPLTLRRIAPTLNPSAFAPRRSTSLFSLGATGQEITFTRRSTWSNHGARSAASNPERPYSFAQYASMPPGVRNLDVQLTVVPPPTQRPWRMLIALSFVLRAADSW